MTVSRKEIYNKAMAEQTDFGTDSIVIDEEIKYKDEFINTPEAIMTLIKKINREKILFRIKTKEGKFLNNNRIVKFAKDHIIVTNPFVLFAEGSFPDEVEINFEDDGIDYSFTTKKISNSGSDKLIGCTLPNIVKILKRRGTYRVKTVKDIPVGIFWIENDKEFIGVINDISEFGIGLKFDVCYFDFEFYNLLKNSSGKILPMIFNINEKVYAIGIIIKYVNKNENEEIILGAEFSFKEEEQQKDIKSYVEQIRKEALFEKSKQLTLHLIKTAEMEG